MGEVDITLSSSLSAGVWDDRELVRAYDAAMEEFHLHHPGPGTWLDKATAALAQSQPLPGAKTYGSRWYSGGKDAALDLDNHVEPATRSNKRQRTTDSQPKRSSKVVNPYDVLVSEQAVTFPTSPRYQPPSPRPSDCSLGGNMPSLADGDAPAVGVHLEAPHTPAINTAANITYEEAMAYALNAQYTAGYWLGVAHAKGPPRVSEASPVIDSATNILRTKQTFPASQAPKFKR